MDAYNVIELQDKTRDHHHPVQPALQIDHASLLEKLHELREILETRLPNPSLPPFCSAELGQIIMQEVSFIKRPPTPGTPILTEVEQEAIKPDITEKDLLAEMTKHFNRILPLSGYPLVFVNSEDFRWLGRHPDSSRQSHMKPDGFVTFQGLFCHREMQGRPVGFKFGTPFAKLLDLIVIFDAKCVIDDASIGEVEMYIRRLPPFARVVLFDRTKCWLIKTFNDRAGLHQLELELQHTASGHRTADLTTRPTSDFGSTVSDTEYVEVIIRGSTSDFGKTVRAMNLIHNINEIMWTDHGSERFFLEFIVEALNHWIRLLESACNVFNVQLLDTDAFLGAGATGRVFKVCREDKTMAALKIVTTDFSLLMLESQKMRSAEQTGVVATVLEDYKILDNGNGAAVLIREIGEPISRESLTESTVVEIVHILFILHSSGIQHGDPRLPNLIQVDGRILWIDLMYSLFDPELRWETDAMILSRSILGLPDKRNLPSEISSLISQYNDQRSEQSCQALARQLWAELSTTGVRY